MSLRLAQKFNGYIISADSRQIYRGMDIGTGKIRRGTWEKNKLGRVLYCGKIPHFMLDLINPDQGYTVAQFQKKVNKIIQKYPHKVPFLVGGTGLYISAVVDGFRIPAIAPDKKLRLRLEKKSAQFLLKKLLKLDPQSAQSIDPHNKRRLIRALEVCLKTGKPFSQLQRKRKPQFDVLKIGVKTDLRSLDQRIEKRVEQMIREGLVSEVKRLGQKYSLNLPALSGIGYREIGMYLRKEISAEQAIALIKQNTRQYARRQITWFKRDRRIHWIKSAKEAEKLIRKFLQN